MRLYGVLVEGKLYVRTIQGNLIALTLLARSNSSVQELHEAAPAVE